VALDLETTGLDPFQHQIIEIGAVRFHQGKTAGEFRSFIRTDNSLDPFIVNLTGITDADLVDAPRFDDIAADLLAFIGDGPIVGQNIEFDLGFLRAAGESLQSRKADNPFIFGGVRAMDTAMLSRVFWPELSSFSLASLAGAFSVRLTEAHRAAADARATGGVLVEMIRALPERVWKELAADLHRLIEPTTHRSRFFFSALAGITKDISRPRPADDVSESARVPRDITEGSLADWFGSGGLLETSLTFFQHRPAQLDLALAVERALTDSSTLLAEAPTGIGKSLAYLIPALRWALQDPEAGRQVIVSSHTKVLQDQLCGKDISELRRAIGGSFSADVLKGRNNYLCLRRLRLLLREAHDRLSEMDRIALMPVLRWAELSRTGDITEINGFNPRSQPVLWAQIASDSLVCSGSTCSAAKGDFYRLAQERAARAQVVFVNHALLVTDLPRYAGGSAKRLVLDEAHQIERAMVGALSQEFSAPVLRNVLARLIDEKLQRGLLPHLAHRLNREDATGELGGYAADLSTTIRTLHATVRQRFALLADELVRMVATSERSLKVRFHAGQKIHEKIVLAMRPILEEWNQALISLLDFQHRLTDLKGSDRLPAENTVELRSVIDLFASTAEQFSTILQEAGLENRVYWIEISRSARANWCGIYSAPISVGELMKTSFWPVVDSAVLTSATLTTGGKFDVLRDTLGVPDSPEHPAREIMLRSPFQLSKQMRTLVPTFLPEPRRDNTGYADALSGLIGQLIEKFPRGTLILSTSNELVDQLTASVGNLARKSGRVVLSQGRSASLADLVREFRRSKNAILIGTSSFWEGIDVVGDALQILIITRLPFDVPSEPWVSARSEEIQKSGRDPFHGYSLPVAALRLKQGIGRLIRHPGDRGIAIVMDPRLFTSRYGKAIRDDLPTAPFPVASSQDLFAQIDSFFSRQDS
jgi:predicted DnaQ family exonuclease/DinG family helicase